MTPSIVRPLKNLSQNFLIDPNITRKIVDRMQIQPDDHIVEIGPGEGALTAMLLKAGPRSLTAIEIDDRLISYLNDRFSKHPGFRLLHQDFLKTDLRSLGPPGGKLRIAGNLPYSITSPILFHILDDKNRISDLTIMVQKEVGERLAAQAGSREYGIPSVLFQAVSTIERLFTVSRNAFKPVPEVDSLILTITFNNSSQYPVDNWHFFKTLVKTAFNHRRKMLRNTLKQWYPEGTSPSIDLSRRPEQLLVSEWIALYNEIQEASKTP